MCHRESSNHAAAVQVPFVTQVWRQRLACAAVNPESPNQHDRWRSTGSGRCISPGFALVQISVGHGGLCGRPCPMRFVDLDDPMPGLETSGAR